MKIIFVNRNDAVLSVDEKLFLWRIPMEGELISLEHYGFVKIVNVSLAFPKTKLPTYPEAIVIRVKTNEPDLKYSKEDDSRDLVFLENL